MENKRRLHAPSMLIAAKYAESMVYKLQINADKEKA